MAELRTINIGADLRPHLGDSFAKLAMCASNFNHATDRNMRLHYLAQLRGEAQLVAQRDASALRHSPLTTDQQVEALAGHRAAGQRVLALCDAVEI